MSQLVSTSKEISIWRIFKLLFIILVSLIFALWALIDLFSLWIFITGEVFNNPNIWLIKIWGQITLSVNILVFWFLFKLFKAGRLKDFVAVAIVLVLILIELYFYASMAFI